MRKLRFYNGFKKNLYNASSWFVVISVIFSSISIILVPHARATTGGQMKLYFHKEASDFNETYNSFSLTPPEPAADTAPTTTTSTTNVNATPPTALCESTDGQTEAQNERIASAASTGNRCLASFISMPIGNAISIANTDTNAISYQLWSSESATQAAVALNVYLYKYDGSTLTRFATITCAEPGTSATSCSGSNTPNPASTVTFAATNRIVAIVSSNVTALRSGADTRFYFDSTGRTASSVSLEYTALGYNTSNKPALTGPMDDDFTTAAGTTACTTAGVTYNTKWTCLLGTSTSKNGSFNAEDTSGSGAGDSSSWLWLSNGLTTTGGGAISEFGITPSNTFLYQSMPSAYGDGDIRTVLNTTGLCQPNSLSCTITANQVNLGIALWSSNTDFMEMGVRTNNATTGTNTVCTYAIVSQGVFNSDGACLNPTTTSGQFNEVWLGWHVHSGIYTPQYSTDGTTWSNIGNSSFDFSHGAFSRVGYTVKTGWGTPVGQVAGAFEWFSSTLAAPTYNQTSYRFFDNTDAVDPTATFNGGTTVQNTPITLTSSGQQFRLRQLINAAGYVGISAQSFKEQYANLSSFGSCSSIPSGNWADLALPTTSDGPNFTGTGADDSSNGGNISWGNLSNITANDGSFASATFNVAGDVTHYLKATNFGFSIPAGSTINGITATVHEMTNATNTDTEIKLIKGGVIQSTNKSTGATWPAGSFVDRTYGSPSDLWGTTWTPSDINSSNFGFALSSTTATTGQARVDSIKITITYTTTGNIAYYDNATPNSGNAINSTGNDPTETGQTVNPQTYQEANPFSNGASTYGYAFDGEWDFSLFDNGSTAGTTYCLRSVKSDGTALTTYTNYPMITTFNTGGPPTPTTDQLLRGGQWFNSGSKQPFYWAQ